MKIKSIISLLLVAVLAICCSVQRELPTQKIETVYRDSVRIKDSTVITLIPKERVVDIVPAYDTLKMATSTAESKSWVDTSLHCLRGEIQAKNALETKIIYKDRIKYEYRDSIQVVELPYPVEVEKKYVPKIYKISLIYLILSLLVVFYGIYRHFRK